MRGGGGSGCVRAGPRAARPIRCVCVRAGARVRAGAFVRACVHARAGGRAGALAGVCILRAGGRAGVFTCACVRACVCTCAGAGGRMRVGACHAVRWAHTLTGPGKDTDTRRS